MIEVIESLSEHGAVVAPDAQEKGAYMITFPFNDAVTTIRITMDDYSGADLVITNMTTLPDHAKGRGFGSSALQALLAWAADSKLLDIRAVQVQKPSERFWIRNQFSKCPEPNMCNDFKYHNR